MGEALTSAMACVGGVPSGCGSTPLSFTGVINLASISGCVGTGAATSAEPLTKVACDGTLGVAMSTAGVDGGRGVPPDGTRTLFGGGMFEGLDLTWMGIETAGPLEGVEGGITIGLPFGGRGVPEVDGVPDVEAEF